MVFHSVNAQVTDEYYLQSVLKYEDHVYKSGIKSVKFHPFGQDQKMPIMELNGIPLVLHFDDLYEDFMNLSYTVVHCNADWTPSNLLPSEYMSSYQEFYFEDYEYSLNTLIAYTNYSLQIPNQNLKLTKSGNYLLKVYANDDKEDLVITRRFMVYENKIAVAGEVKRASYVELNKTHQEVDFIINHSNYFLQDPYSDLKVAVLQNQRWDNAITNLKPRFIQNTILNYNYEQGNTFEGLNEFRFFDIKNLFSLTLNVAKIDRDSIFKVYLREMDARSLDRYVTYDDINGQFRIRRLDATNSNSEADYALVDFLLNMEIPLTASDVYVYGRFTDWKLLPEYKMKYDTIRKAYRLKTYLKQGYYNYVFAIKDDNAEHIDISHVEGSYWETENDYQIFVYNRQLGERYDRLIGYTEFNSFGL